MSRRPIFDNPPVREVSLTVMFESIKNLRTLDLAPLRVAWKDDYPKLSEMAPLAPWQRTERNTVEFVGTGSNWPVPLCLFTNEPGDRVLQLQSDRFILSWRFDPGLGRYPGYEELRGELAERFSHFSEAVNDGLGLTPMARRVEASYKNLIGGIKPDDLALGILTEWQAPRRTGRQAADYIGLRVHHCAAEQDPEVGVVIGVDPGYGLTGTDEAEDKDSSTLLLEMDSDVEEDGDYLAQLTRAHDVLVETFLSVTTQEMKKEWGERT